MQRIHTPYRVCPLGAHVDHQYGVVSGFALDRGVTLSFEPAQNGALEITSRNFGGGVRSTVRGVTDRKMHWGDYARAAVAALRNEKYDLSTGFRGEIEGTLPIGGLSSSASVIITYLRALCALNNIPLTQKKLIDLAHWAETRYIGLNNGVLDQSCEIYSKKNCLLFLDTRPSAGENSGAPFGLDVRDRAFELIPQPGNMPDYEIMIAFSGIEHALVDSAYNARVDECKAAAYALKAFSGSHYGKLADTRLRDVEPATFERYGDRLPEPWRRRALHYYTEVARVRRGIELWRMGDLHGFGSLIFESGDSSINNYESGSPELKALHDIARETDGVYGGRFSGAGFKGCYMAFTDPRLRAYVTERVTKAYLARFPELRDRFGIHFCTSADGVDFEHAAGEASDS